MNKISKLSKLFQMKYKFASSDIPSDMYDLSEFDDYSCSDFERLFVEEKFPMKRQVCPECDGEGSVLMDGMRGHAYTQEEFMDSFDEEEAEEYFRSGGKYDVECPVCEGRNVIPVIAEDKLNAAQEEVYNKYLECKKEEADFEALHAAERRFGA